MENLAKIAVCITAVLEIVPLSNQLRNALLLPNVLTISSLVLSIVAGIVIIYNIKDAYENGIESRKNKNGNPIKNISITLIYILAIATQIICLPMINDILSTIAITCNVIKLLIQSKNTFDAFQKK